MKSIVIGAAALSVVAGGAQAADIVVGTEHAGVVGAFTTPALDRSATFIPYAPGFAGGVRVAVGDVNGDGVADIATGVGRDGQQVKVFDGRTGAELKAFNPFDAGYTGGVRVALGDVNGDGHADIVVGAGTGSRVRVFDGNTLDPLHDFNAFDAGFTGGVSVAVGQGDDGRATLVVGAGAGGSPVVRTYDTATGMLLSSFLAFDVGFTGGVNVAALTKAGPGTLILGAASGGSEVRVFDGHAFTHDFFAFGRDFTGGVSVAAGDFGGLDSLFVGMQEGGSDIGVFELGSGRTLKRFTAFPGADGVNVAGSFAAAVPEPATWALLIAGFGFAGATLRRRRAIA